LLCAAVALTEQQSPAAGTMTFAALMQQSMERMHHGMSAAPASGIPDRDFVTMMVPRSRGTIRQACDRRSVARRSKRARPL